MQEKDKDQNSNETAAKMIKPPRPDEYGCFPPYQDMDLELAAKSLEFAAEILRRHACYQPPYYKKYGTEPPPEFHETQVDVGEESEQTIGGRRMAQFRDAKK